ncbi:MAG: hypothetical protein LBH24_04450 [Clostridiales bacterium]|jgi:hypothetical protein|nr:hypothetical protein [Clostridiales bacterium]
MKKNRWLLAGLALLMCAAFVFAACDEAPEAELLDQAALKIDAVADKIMADPDFQLKTTGGSGEGAVTFSRTAGTDAIATVSGAGLVSIKGVGDIKVKAAKAADKTYNAVESDEITIKIVESPILFREDFSTDKSDLFGTMVEYTGTRYNATAKTMSLLKGLDTLVAPHNTQGPFTRFGKDEDKNFPWEPDGMIVKIDVKIDKASMADNDGFQFTLSLNDSIKKDGAYVHLTERNISFQRYGDEVKVGAHGGGAGLGSCGVATSAENAAAIADGWYTAVFKLYFGEDDMLLLDLSLLNAGGTDVFSENEQKVQGFRADGAFDPETTDIGGLRALWVAYMSCDSIEVDNLIIEKVE